MAKNDSLPDFLLDVASTLRAKTGTTAKINPQDFSSVIASIETATDPKLQNKTVNPTTSQQSVKADSGYDGLNSVTVTAVTSSIDANISAGNIKSGVSILGVTGTLQEGITPEGTLEIKENGSHNVANYEWAEVSVEADLNERVIIGKWANYETGYFFEFKENGECVYVVWEGTYTISGNNINIVINLETASPVTVTYNRETDTIIIPADETEPEITLTRVPLNIITKEITENGTYKASDDGVDGYSEVVVNVASSGGGGGSVSSTFGDNDWDTIAKVAADISYNAMTSEQVATKYGWNLGDVKSETLTTGEVIGLQIIGYNHDDKSDGTGKAGITLQMVNLMATITTMGGSTNAGGWGTSKMRTEKLPTIKLTLPQALQNVIKLVDKKFANGGSSNYSKTETVSDDLFLLAEIELKSSITIAQDGENEGSTYEYWQSGVSKAKKYDANGDGVPDTNYVWGLRSCFYNATNKFVAVQATGYGVQDSLIYGNIGISFAFCV